MNKFTSAGLALLSTTALMSASSAFAQDGTSFGDDVVISTATRRPQALQDVPIAVTVLAPEVLEKQGVVNVQNLSIVAPSFAASQAQTASGTVVLRIRGVGTTSNNIGFESAVGVFIDGAYQSRPGIALGEFVDVDKVEVLRGPQGTLFGRNTSAGALKIVNKGPDLAGTDVSGFVNATYGNYDHKSLQGAINIPIVEDKLAARVTGAYRNRNGYIKLFDGNGNRFGESNGINQFMLRGQLGWEGDSGFKGRLIVDHSNSDAPVGAAIEVQQADIETAGLFAAVGLGQRGGMAGPDVAIGSNDEGAAQDAVDNLIGTASFEPGGSSDQTGFTLEMEYPLNENIDLIYTGSLRNYDAEEDYDSDFSGLDVFNVRNSPVEIDTMTHEVRLQGSAFDDRLSWLAGAYYSDEEITQQVNFELGADYGELVGARLFAPTGGALGANPLTVFSGVDPAGTSISQNYAQDSTSFSLFTHNVFDVTDQLSLTLGLRYSDESKDGSFGQSNINNQICPATLGSIGAGNVPGALTSAVFGLGCLAFLAPADLPQAAVFPLPRTFDEEFKDDELIYTAKIGYEIAPAVSTYASFTHGYKSGGFNLDSTAASGGADPSFLSEEVDAYEIGLKSRLLDNMLTLNVAAFIQNFDNFQVLEFTGAQFTTFNVPKANSTGVEIEAVARPTDGLTLNGALTLLDASYPDDCAGDNTTLNVTSLCGNSLTNAPDAVGILGANYEGSLTENLNYFLNAQMRYESDRRTSTQAVVLATQAANPYDIQPSTTKINSRIGITNEDAGYALELWATNLTNERTRGVTFNTVFRAGNVTSRSAFIQEPRMFGATVRKNF